MEPPKNIKLIELPTSTMWFDELGIVYSKPKPYTVAQTREETKILMDQLRKAFGGEKKCMILETGHEAPPTKREDREWIAAELESITKAMAIITTSALGKMMAILFFLFNTSTYPF